MKLEDASHADYVCIGLAPHCMNGCTPDAPIPARTWVWTSIITFGPVQTDLNTHLFIYLNLLTSACHIFMLEVFWCWKNKTKKQTPSNRCKWNAKLLQDTSQTCGRSLWGCGPPSSRLVQSCSNKSRHTFIYLIFWLVAATFSAWRIMVQKKETTSKQVQVKLQTFARDTGKSCGRPVWGLGCGLDHRVLSCSNESRRICVFTRISSAVAATHRHWIYYNVDTGQTCGLVQTHCVVFHVKVQEILQERTGGHAASKPNTSVIADISWRAHSNGAHTSPYFAMEMRCICVWWHLWLGVILRRFFCTNCR